jgi:GH25 family lysozyme M1 (1,4-beta-N-acetylmuramidase)
LREPKLKDDSQWLFWQYTSAGKIKGIKGRNDFNVFYGTLEELDRFCLQPREILK